MAGLFLAQLAILAINIIFLTLFVAVNTDFCGSVFETQVGKLTHVLTVKKVLSSFKLKAVEASRTKHFRSLSVSLARNVGLKGDYLTPISPREMRVDLVKIVC